MEEENKPEADAPSPAPEAPKQEAPKTDAPKPAAAKKDNERLLAALSYVGILFLVPLLVSKDNEFCRYHVRQGIALFAIEVLLSFGFLHPSVGGLISVAIFVISVICIVKTLKGEKWELPLVGHYAQKIKL